MNGRDSDVEQEPNGRRASLSRRRLAATSMKDLGRAPSGGPRSSSQIAERFPEAIVESERHGEEANSESDDDGADYDLFLPPSDPNRDPERGSPTHDRELQSSASSTAGASAFRVCIELDLHSVSVVQNVKREA